MAKPTKPRWATTDVVDPITGQNNVVEPIEEKKNIGWEYREKPPRQYFNWLARQTYLWIDYLDWALTRNAIITVAASNTQEKLKDEADFTCSGSNDQDTINEAIDYASSYYEGALIVLLPGEYNLSSPINISGKKVAGLIGSGTNSSYGTRLKASANNIDMVYTTDSDITLANMYLSGIGTVDCTAVNIAGGQRIVIENLRIESFSTDGAPVDPFQRGAGILLNSSFSIVNDCYINYTDGDAIQVIGEFNRIVCNYINLPPTIYNSTGIRIKADHNIVSNNEIVRENRSGIVVENSAKYITVSANRVSKILTDNSCYDVAIANNIVGHIGVDSSFTTVVSNTIYGNQDNCSGIKISSSVYNSTISGNTIHFAEQHGILLEGTQCNVSNNVVWNCSASSSSFDGIRVNGNDNTVIGNNVRYDPAATNKQQYGISVYGDNNLISHNDLVGSGELGAIYLDAGASGNVALPAGTSLTDGNRT